MSTNTGTNSGPNADATFGELMSQLSSQTARLVRDEMRLAQREIVQSAKRAGAGAGLFGAAVYWRFSVQRASSPPPSPRWRWCCRPGPRG